MKKRRIQEKNTSQKSKKQTSFHTQNATKHTSNHIQRISETTYLIEPNSENNEYKKYDLNQEDFIAHAKQSYQERTGQTMQKKQLDSLIKETVITVKKDTGIEDIERLFNNLNKEFGGHKLFEIAIHKDEGYFYNIKEGLKYRPNADIFYNKENKNFYLDKEYNEKVNINNFEKRYNYHAHAVYSTFDLDQGKGRMSREDMRKVQTITAASLEMTRGQEYSKSERMNHWQLKQQADIKRATKKELIQETDKEITALQKGDFGELDKTYRNHLDNLLTEIEELNFRILSQMDEIIKFKKLKDPYTYEKEKQDLEQEYKNSLVEVKLEYKKERELMREEGGYSRSEWAELEQKHKEKILKLEQKSKYAKIELKTAQKTILSQTSIIDELKASKSQISQILSLTEQQNQELEQKQNQLQEKLKQTLAQNQQLQEEAQELENTLNNSRKNDRGMGF